MSGAPRRPSSVLATGAIVWGFASAAAAQTPASIDLRVNTYTSGVQSAPAVAVDADENFVVVWDSAGQDGDRGGVFARRFDAAGSPLGPEFQVNTYTVDAQARPAIAMSPAGDFVVVWQSHRQDGSYGGVFGQAFDAAGNKLGSEFQVNDYATHAQRRPAVAMDDAGGFVVVWQGYTPGGLWDVWGRRFDASGNALDPEFLVNAYSTDLQGRPSVAVDAAGNFVVVWESYRRDAASGYLSLPVHSFGRRFDASGVPQGPDFPVSSSTTQTQAAPRIGMTPGGSFMVAWQGDFFRYGGVYARVFDASGAPAGPDVPVDVTLPPVDPDDHILAGAPSVAADDAGDFVVAWHRTSYRYYDEDNYGYFDHQIRTRRYDPSGSPRDAGSPASTSWHPWWPKGGASVATRRAGRFIVAWQGYTQGAAATDVFARSPDVIFSDAFETRDFSSWSAAASDDGDASVSSAASMPARPWPGFGLQALVNDQASLFVQDDTPAGETRYRARFYLDPNGFDPGESVGHLRQHVFLAFSEAPLKRLVLLMLRRIGGQYAIGAHVRRDDDTLAKSAFVPITDGPHAVEFDWQKASAPGADDGRFELWIDGTSVLTLTGLDNDERPVDFVRMGALSVKAGASGTLYFDEFVSRRLAYIGP